MSYNTVLRDFLFLAETCRMLLGVTRVWTRQEIARQAFRANPAEMVLRSIAALNLSLILLMCCVWYEGTLGAPGISSAFFGRFRVGGFRADEMWLAVSTIVLFTAMPLVVKTTSPTRKLTALICFAEYLAFSLFVYRFVTHIAWTTS